MSTTRYVMVLSLVIGLCWSDTFFPCAEQNKWFFFLLLSMVYGDILNDPEERKNIIKEQFGIEEEKISERVVVTPVPFNQVFPEDLEERLSRLGITSEWFEVRDPILRTHHGNLFLEKNGKTGFLAFLGRGLIDFTEKIRLLCLVPHVKEILFLGSAGSLQPNVMTGDLNIPQYAIPFEDISTIYVDVTRAVPEADPELWKAVVSLAKKTGLTVHTRLHATVPFIYMETKEFLEYLKDVGVVTIDMEVTSFFRITKFHGKKAAALLRVSDMPLTEYRFYSENYEEWKKGRKERALDAFLRIALEFLQLK